MLYARGGDRRMKSNTHKFLWWVADRQEAVLNFALMGLVLLPIFVWVIIFLLVVNMRHGQALMRWAAPPLRQPSCAAAPAPTPAMQPPRRPAAR